MGGPITAINNNVPRKNYDNSKYQTHDAPITAMFPSTSTMAIVDTLLVTANVAFFYAILIWLLLHTLRQSKLQRAVFLQQRPKFFSIITLLFNFILTLLTIAFAVHEYRTNKIVRYSSVTFALTWVMASLVSFYSMKKTTRDNKRFPFVLVLWWVLTSIIEAISISIGLMKNNFEYLDFWNFFSEDDNIVGVVSLPMLLLLLCLNLCAREEQHNTDMEQLLVHPGEEDDDDDEDGENFTTVGIWSQLTFRWLNPIFRKGRVQKLELAHIPDVPHSETAENASSLLEESLGKQKLEGDSLTKAITSSVWKSLALNAVFAGVNTIASYIIQCDLILAFIFFLSKTLESLSQRGRYFGAQRIGIQVRAALMTLIYSKSLMIKCAGPTHGKIINLVNVVVERIEDFCWYIHGVWLLPVQVSLGLVILYINLGFLPSISALVVTILVMVCNTPLANMQEKLHSKIMEAKNTRIKMTSKIMKNIRILKLHSWESTFLPKLLQLRDTEKSWLQKYLYTRSAVATLFWTSPSLVSVVTFGICILVNTELTVATVLSALATFRILQEPIYNLPEVISMIAQTKVSLDRIQELINEEDQNQFMNKHTSKDS
ncbi:hypothetical protein HN51_062623 [Arachis hypogaea]